MAFQPVRSHERQVVNQMPKPNYIPIDETYFMVTLQEVENIGTTLMQFIMDQFPGTDLSTIIISNTIQNMVNTCKFPEQVRPRLDEINYTYRLASEILKFYELDDYSKQTIADLQYQMCNVLRSFCMEVGAL